MIIRNFSFDSFTAAMEENGPIYRLHCSADLTSNVAEDMSWDVLNDQSKLREGLNGGAPLTGGLTVAEFKVTPNDRALKKNSLKLTGGHQIVNFKLSTPKVDGVRQLEMRFILKTRGPIEEIVRYWLSCGVAGAELRLTTVQKLKPEQEAPTEPEADPNQPELFENTEEEPEAAAAAAGGNGRKRNVKPIDQA